MYYSMKHALDKAPPLSEGEGIQNSSQPTSASVYKVISSQI